MRKVKLILTMMTTKRQATRKPVKTTTPEGYTVIGGMMFVHSRKTGMDGRSFDVYIRRCQETNTEVIVADYGHGCFSIGRESGAIVPVSQYKDFGYLDIDESEFNDIYIEAVEWIIKNKPARKRKKNVNN